MYGWSSLRKNTISYFFFLAMPCRMQDLNKGSNPHPLHWKCGFLTTGLPRKSPKFLLFNVNENCQFSIPGHESASAKSLQSCLIVCDLMDHSSAGSSVHGNSPGKNTGVSCHALLLEIFPTQGPASLTSSALAGRYFTTCAIILLTFTVFILLSVSHKALSSQCVRMRV